MRPSQRFPFWTSQRTALYIKLLFGCRCLLHGVAHTTSGLAAVFAVSGTFRGAGAGWHCSPRYKLLNFTALGFCGANSTNEGGERPWISAFWATRTSGTRAASTAKPE